MKHRNAVKIPVELLYLAAGAYFAAGCCMFIMSCGLVAYASAQHATRTLAHVPKDLAALRIMAPEADTPRLVTASWYGKKFHGRKTACGNRYDMYNISVAHRELPCGTMVRFVNPANGYEIVAPVTDRGPYDPRPIAAWERNGKKGPVPLQPNPNREYDHSFGAAWVLDFVKPGTAKLKAEVVASPSP